MDRPQQQRLEALYRPLWLTYGLVPLLAGIDKFFDLLTDWAGYLSPAIAGLLPVSPQTFMSLVGVIEILAGLMVLTRWPRTGAWVVAAWLVLIAGNLILLGLYDIAVRDLAMAVGAYSLVQLAAAREAAPAGALSAGSAEARARRG
jgi:hypothetical protein